MPCTIFTAFPIDSFDSFYVSIYPAPSFQFDQTTQFLIEALKPTRDSTDQLTECYRPTQSHDETQNCAMGQYRVMMNSS